MWKVEAASVNLLEQFINDSGDWDAIPAMNLLQDQGVISDNCISLADVADADAPAAIAFLELKTL
jgi:hypothetical protein